MSGSNLKKQHANISNIFGDISIMSPGGQPYQQQQSPDTLQRAKLRLETVCLLLAESGNISQKEKDKQQAAIANVLEEVVTNQPNKFDS